MTQGISRPAVPRRVEALCFILQRIRSTGTSPSYFEIGDAMNPRVGQSRARQYVEQLVDLGAIGRDLASRRGIKIINHTLCRQLIDQALGDGGWHHAAELGKLQAPPYTFEQLPVLPLIELPPDPH